MWFIVHYYVMKIVWVCVLFFSNTCDEKASREATQAIKGSFWDQIQARFLTTVS